MSKTKLNVRLLCNCYMSSEFSKQEFERGKEYVNRGRHTADMHNNLSFKSSNSILYLRYAHKKGIRVQNYMNCFAV